MRNTIFPCGQLRRPGHLFVMVSSFINSQVGFMDILYRKLAMYLLLFLSLWHVRQVGSRRLWMLPFRPSKLVALNAGTLALLTSTANPPITDFCYRFLPPRSPAVESIFVEALKNLAWLYAIG